MKTSYRLVLVAAVLAGCAPTRAADPRGEPVLIDDKGLSNRLLRISEQLVKDGKVTPLAELRAQLGRRACTLDLGAAPTRRMTPDRIYATYRPSVLVLAGVFKCGKCTRWHATTMVGFLITGSGALVTNYHAVDNAKHVTLVAMTHDGRVLPVKEILAASKDDDVAILQLDAAGLRFRPVALSTSAPAGAPVSVISHPAKRFYTLTRGVVSRYFGHKTRGKMIPRMHITADFARGSSGGPVFNEYGAVVGLVKSTTSIYYDASEGKKGNLQMVFKECVPASQVLQLIKPPGMRAKSRPQSERD